MSGFAVVGEREFDRKTGSGSMNSKQSGWSRARVLAGIVALSTACAGHEMTAPALAASLSISSAGQTVFEVLQTLQLTATVRDTSGALLTGQSVAWTSSDTTIASVSPSGLAKGKKPGTVIITATCDGRQAPITLTVAPPVAGVLVGLSPPGDLAVGGSMFVFATAVAANGDTISGLPVSWSSSNSSLATVAPYDVFLAVVSGAAAGNVSIAATVDGVTGSTNVIVVPLSAVASIVVHPATVTYVAGPMGFGASTQLSLTATDAGGNLVLGVPVTWSISNDTAATLSATGLLTPNPAVFYSSMVTATVTATVAGLSKSVPVVVCPEVASIEVSTTAISLVVGQAVVLAATALDAHGNLERAPLTSETVFPNGMTVSEQRTGFDSLLVTGKVPGTATLIFRDATSGVQSQTIAISVSASALSAEHAAGRGAVWW
jgi:trimeric autotransporter adhesin